MHRPSSYFLALASTVVLAACSDGAGGLAAPNGAVGVPVDTSGIAPSILNVSGHVFAIQATPAAQGSDTLHYIPIAGVSLRLMHNILVDGQSAQELAGTTVSGADGAYGFANLPGGYYVLYAEPSAASGYAGSYSLVPRTPANVLVDMYVWRK